jgi:hypothetical protein
MDEDGYPEPDEIEMIEKWDITKKSVIDLLEYVRKRWNYADIGYFKLTGKRKLRLELHTGGWSGNEEIISALMTNTLFWMMYWQKSERGGHYWFLVPIDSL